MGYPRVPMAFLWPNGGNKTIWGNIQAKNIFFFSKKYFMSFLPHYCHSFHSTVIPSGLLSFLPDYCHSFRISVIPSEYCHSFGIIQRQMLTSSKNFLYPRGEKNGHRRWPYMRVYLKSKCTRGKPNKQILNASKKVIRGLKKIRMWYLSRK